MRPSLHLVGWEVLFNHMSAWKAMPYTVKLQMHKKLYEIAYEVETQNQSTHPPELLDPNHKWPAEPQQLKRSMRSSV